MQVSMAFMLKKATRLMENHGIKEMEIEVYGGMELMIGYLVPPHTKVHTKVSGLVGPLTKVIHLELQS